MIGCAAVESWRSSYGLIACIVVVALTHLAVAWELFAATHATRYRTISRYVWTWPLRARVALSSVILWAAVRLAIHFLFEV